MSSTLAARVKGESATSRWIVRPRIDPKARLRLFCFPHAGGGASAYHSWAKSIEVAEVCAIQLPGRETRLCELPLDSLRDVMDPLVSALVPLTDLPYALFGHSLGAVLCFEVARELRRRGGRGPSRLIVSGRRAPSVQVAESPLHPLPDDLFVAELCRRYGGIPRVILEEPELLALFLPALRADLKVLETHAYRDEEPLGCEIVAVGGSDDPHAREESLRSWESLTTGPFSISRLPGGHFYLHDDRQGFLRWLSATLDRSRGRGAGE